MPNTPDNRKRQHTHYDVLQLPRTRHGEGDASLLKEDIKTAYRRALLVHHPDKAAHSNTNPFKPSIRPQKTPTYSIDDIVLAYEILLDPEKRAAYDRTLEQDAKCKETGTNNDKDTHIGLEDFDLEDLKYDEIKNIWTKSCRCGNEEGYMLTESDLENESLAGEIYVGCRGCSLFIKVLFALDEL